MRFARLGTLIVLLSPVMFAATSAQDQLAAGKEALLHKAYNEAIADFQEVLKTDDHNADANFFLGQAYKAKGVYDSAQMYLERVIDLNENYVPADTSLFGVYAKEGLWDMESKRFDEATKSNPNDPNIPSALGNIYLDVDSLDKAVIYFSKAKEINNNFAPAYVGLGEAYERQNIFVLAITDFQTAAQFDSTNADIHFRLGKAYYKNRQYNESAREFEKAIDLNPKDSEVIFDLADLYYRAKLWVESAKFFEKYVALKNDNPVAAEEYAKSLYNTAVAYKNVSYFKRAVPILNRAIELNPTMYDLKPMLANALYETDDAQQAITAYNALPKDSLNAEDYAHLGRAYEKLKDTANAILDFQKSSQMDSSSTEVTGDLAAIFVEQRQFDQAADEYRRKLKDDPDNIGALYYGGFSNYMIGRFDTAKVLYERFVKLRPDYIPGRMFLARTCVAMDSTDLGRKVYGETLDFLDSLSKADTSKSKEEQYDQDRIDVYRGLAAIDYGEKEYVKAIDNLKKAVEYEPKDIKKKDDALHLFLAQMYNIARSIKTLTPDEVTAYKDKAVEEYNYVLRINPKNPTARKELDQLTGK
jgi:tetratricopeptide (TPR) repeat protein